MKDARWHRAQAKKISKNAITLAIYWWEIGDKLNQAYGYISPEGIHGEAQDQARIPGADMDELEKVYQTSKNAIRSARRFSSMARTREEAETVAREYRTWTNVIHGYLPGHDADETQVRQDARQDSENAKTKTARQIAKHVAEHAIVTVPDEIRDELALSGYDSSELIRDILTELGAQGVIDVAEQLDVIKRPRKPRVRVARITED